MGGKPEASVFGSTRLISGLTLVSRLLGVLRDAVSAAYFGAGVIWDAFSFAFRVPNLFRRLFGEGALAAAFIPIFTGYIERGDEAEIRRTAGAVGGVLTAVLLVSLALGEGVCAVLLGAGQLSEKWHLALALTAVMLPYSFLICMTAFAGGILHAYERFAAPAFAPVVLNLCWIAAVWLAAPMLVEGASARVFVLAGGILVAGVLQLGVQGLALRASGLRLTLRWEPGHEAVRRCFRKMAPIVFGLAVFQLNVLMDGVIAIGLAAPADGPGVFTLLGRTVRFPLVAGANSVLYYGDRLMQFPLGVFGIALATALFPRLSRHASRKDWTGFSCSLGDAASAVWFIGLPASVGLMVLREPAVRLLFERGAFTPAMTARTAAVVLAYSSGVWAYCAIHVLMRAFYALEDTVTPVKVSASMVALNLTLNLTLVWWLREAGMAAATALCAAVQVVVLGRILARRGRLRPGRGMIGSLLKTAVATALMVPVCRAAVLLLGVPTPGLGRKALVVLAGVSAGGAAFLAASWAMRNGALAVVGERRAKK